MLGVNEAGQESGNQTAVQNNQLPLLQDDASADVWNTWAVAYRDVVILDGAGKKRGVFNLTEHDLSVEANRTALLELLRDAAK